MNNSNLTREWENIIDELSAKTSRYKEFSYFLEVMTEYRALYKRESVASMVFMIGNCFPEEIIKALGVNFRYVRGLETANALIRDLVLPKDADDETESIFRELTGSSLRISKNDVLLIPLYSDSMKKLKILMEEYVTVVCYEMPSDKEDLFQRKRFTYEIDRVTNFLKKHFKKKLSLKALKAQCRLSEKAAEVFCEFEELCREKAGIFPTSALVFIANSYHICKDKAEWTLHLEELTKELKECNESDINCCPEVLLFGSPVYAPNFKILFAIEEEKMFINTIIHTDIEHIKTAKNFNERTASVSVLAEMYLDYDISTAYICLTKITEMIKSAISSGRIKGIIAYILKGQIEYDYRYRTVEKELTGSEILVNRIETSYNYQDIEQIHLRLQAIYETINNRNI